MQHFFVLVITCMIHFERIFVFSFITSKSILDYKLKVSNQSDKSDNLTLKEKLRNKRKFLKEKTLKFAKSIVINNFDDSSKNESKNKIDRRPKEVFSMLQSNSARIRVEKAFEAAEIAMKKAELAAEALKEATIALSEAKSDLYLAFSDEGMTGSDISDEIDYSLSEMAPPFIDENSCLIPGEPLVRIEKAPSNSRRIFAGIDIVASVDDVWEVLTEYSHLQDVIPNLVTNEVLEYYVPEASDIENHTSELSQYEILSKQLKGVKLKQVGGAKVIGVNFSARLTLDVREWPNGLPDDITHDYNSEIERRKFPRPFAISSLPTKDITMQSVVNDDGEFRIYQGVWRMQPLPGCAPEDGNAMRLTYAVELSPRSYLPVALIEGRIAKDLCNNLIAIRKHVSKS